VIFGIDGIGGTSSVHRRNTDYNKVIRNATAYILAGGKAKWDFIVFKHNEHQVNMARQLSKELGFLSFQVKKTSRFSKNLYENDNELDSTYLEYGKHPIFSNEGQVIDCLELPQDRNYRNNTEETIFQLIDKYGSMENYFDNVRIDCQAIKTNGVFVSALGEVYPCCTVYQQVCYGSINGVKDCSELNEYKIWLNSDISAFNSSIKEIVEGSFFKQLQKDWSTTCLSKGKPKSCCRTCGVELDMHNAQHSEIKTLGDSAK